ncbi:hypothetical protein BCR37DRAFT_383238 [Protomyces lactucae-debilis]|uniref:Uncharacterized protein n=1 Tax=Protomyces lactucae-debilis TaxID=2754530 RepID=A0A1Y2EZS1_PROLT|nr:uncharacterized protein BCR37DRAFT_383238 [Protomyces lactucae-debilis]ORY76616.1 hypothetical protein BCR37DRAFT_383238 [Protomyces lactucae-debilis]
MHTNKGKTHNLPFLLSMLSLCLLQMASTLASSCDGELASIFGLDVTRWGFNCTNIQAEDNLCIFPPKTCYYWSLKPGHKPQMKISGLKIKYAPSAKDLRIRPCKMLPEEDFIFPCWILKLDWSNEQGRQLFAPQYRAHGNPHIIFCGQETRQDSSIPKNFARQAKALFPNHDYVASCALHYDPDRGQKMSCSLFTAPC